MPRRIIKLNWKGYYEYTAENVRAYAPLKAGVYKIGIKQNNGTLTVRYIGQANDLDRRLKEHLDLDNEQNKCIAERLNKYHAKFSFAEVATQNDRDGVELSLYSYYTPVCNNASVIPDGPDDGPDIEINYK